MNKIPRLSNKETIILKMLINNPKSLYGLEMVKMSEGLLKTGTIYVTLNRMEEKGYISSKKEDKNHRIRGVTRRIYKPTGLGEKTYSFLEIFQSQWDGVSI